MLQRMNVTAADDGRTSAADVSTIERAVTEDIS
jgi:hypothetical protein